MRELNSGVVELSKKSQAQSRTCDRYRKICIFITVVAFLIIWGIGFWNDQAKADPKLQEKVADVQTKN